MHAYSYNPPREFFEGQTVVFVACGGYVEGEIIKDLDNAYYQVRHEDWRGFTTASVLHSDRMDPK